jgi:hypothetical protein
VPAYTVERLRKITRADLDRILATIAEYEIRTGSWLPSRQGKSQPGQGVRRKDDHIQFGLTKLEIDGVEQRLKNLLKRVDDGKLKTF